MSSLKAKLETLIPKLRDERKAIMEKHGDHDLGAVVVEQVIGGMRGIPALVCDTSEVTPENGLIVRGIPIAQLTERLPEEMFWLLLTGELPNPAELKEFQADLFARQHVPDYVFKLLDAFPAEAHPMTMLNAGILAMQPASKFAKQYAEGTVKKADYWAPILEDSLDLMANVSIVAAYIFKIKYQPTFDIHSAKASDWGAQFARMLNMPQQKSEADEMMRLYLTLHADHEGGNVSAFASNVVGSALSDPYYTVSAGLNGLAGPLHGLANQECQKFWIDMQSKLGDAPSDAEITAYIKGLLADKKVIPGYGHAVLRSTDPRFVALHAFGKEHFANDPIFRLVDRGYALIPGILKEQGKVKSPFPNVDAGSGAMLWHFGLRQFEFYTVFFAVSRTMGLLAQLILARALNTSITRPKSVTTAWIKQQIEKSFAAHMQASLAEPVSHLLDPANQVWHQHGFVEQRPFAA